MKIGDVVQLHCPDARCACCDHMPPGRIVEISTVTNARDKGPRWQVKLLFGVLVTDWPERAITLLMEAPSER